MTLAQFHYVPSAFYSDRPRYTALTSILSCRRRPLLSFIFPLILLKAYPLIETTPDPPDDLTFDKPPSQLPVPITRALNHECPQIGGNNNPCSCRGYDLPSQTGCISLIAR